MNAPPVIDRVSAPIVRAFAQVLAEPDRWFTAAELRTAASTAESTIYRRFANLASARAVLVRRHADFRQFKLHPRWLESPLGRELHGKAHALGLVDESRPLTAQGSRYDGAGPGR